LINKKRKMCKLNRPVLRAMFAKHRQKRWTNDAQLYGVAFTKLNSLRRTCTPSRTLAKLQRQHFTVTTHTCMYIVH